MMANITLILTSSLFFFLTSIIIVPIRGDGPTLPSLDFKPSSLFKPAPFGEIYANNWGPQHQTLGQSEYGAVTLSLDRAEGSGFRSEPYMYGYFEASIMLPNKAYTAGLNVAFYLSNDEEYHGCHDEVDIEFLGHKTGESYRLQTNIYVNGSGDGFFDQKTPVVGREMTYKLWFNPTTSSHRYALLWNSDEIIFFVDDIPIRYYPRVNEVPYLKRKMRAYASIWDASNWATEHGKYRMNYTYAPFQARYSSFKVAKASDVPSGLTDIQKEAMNWTQQAQFKVYDYCINSPKPPPECGH